MADIAATWGWSLSEMRELTLDELIAWHDRAVTRWQRMYGKQEGSAG